MPEEINRLVTDRLSNLLLTPDKLSSENLRKERVPEEKIQFVGNIMIDTLEANRSKAEQLNPETIIKDNLIEGQSLNFLKKSQNSDSYLTTQYSKLNTHHSPLTLRWNTERPVTLREHGGASVLVGNNIERISKEYQDTLRLEPKPQRPELWDGNSAERCLRAIVENT